MGKILKSAFSAKLDGNFKEQLNYIKKVYLTAREISLSESIYRLLPSLNLKLSNVATSFISTGFPTSRTDFFNKVNINKDDVSNVEIDGKNYIEIDGLQGIYAKALSKHEKYSARPDKLANPRSLLIPHFY